MWSTYTKTFVFRDCLAEEIVMNNVKVINKMLGIKQHKGERGAFICTDLMGTSTATSIEACRLEDTGEWTINFYGDDFEQPPVATVTTIEDFKEIQLQFEIEENIDDGDFIIHYCTIKGFKEYQK